MNREEILEKSRKENQDKDVAELSVINSASSIAVKIGIIVCCAVSTAEVLIKDKMNCSCWLIYFSMLTTIFGVKFFRLKRKHEAVFAALFAVCFIIMAVFYIKGLAA